MTAETARALADAVKARRITLGMRQHDLEAHGGPSHGTVRRIERITGPITLLPGTVAALDRALAWPGGTVQRILDGDLDAAAAAALPRRHAEPPPAGPLDLVREVAKTGREDLIARARSRPDALLRCTDCRRPLPPAEPEPSLFPGPDGGDTAPRPAQAEASAWFGSAAAWGVAWLDRVLVACDGETDPEKLTVRAGG